MSPVFGILLVVLAGLGTGTFVWPMKLQKKFQFEHWFFVAMLAGLIIVPWAVTLIFIPDAIGAFRSIDRMALLKANLFGLAWGVANVLGGIAFVRIGVALTGGFLTGLGLSVGVTLPLVLKGSGLFSDAPDILSTPGLVILCAVAIMIVAVVFLTLAGFGRDRVLQKTRKTAGSILGGIVIAAIAGATSCGIGLAFIYGQDPIVKAMTANGAGQITSMVAVWAGAIFFAALVNVLYPAYLMTKNKNWGVLTGDWKEVGLSAIIGVQFIVAVTLMGKGMLLLGAAGGAVGFGIQQASQVIGNQALGFISGEWRGVYGKPRSWMYLAIFLILVAAAILAYAKSLAG